jgi:hypothetical protein
LGQECRVFRRVKKKKKVTVIRKLPGHLSFVSRKLVPVRSVTYDLPVHNWYDSSLNIKRL